jgi:hypothetical protein
MLVDYNYTTLVFLAALQTSMQRWASASAVLSIRTDWRPTAGLAQPSYCSLACTSAIVFQHDGRSVDWPETPQPPASCRPADLVNREVLILHETVLKSSPPSSVKLAIFRIAHAALF